MALILASKLLDSDTYRTKNKTIINVFFDIMFMIISCSNKKLIKNSKKILLTKCTGSVKTVTCFES